MLRILFATDGFEAAEGAARFLRCLPLPAGTEIRIASVKDTTVGALLATYEVPEVVRRAEQQRADAAIARAREALAREGLVLSEETPDGEAAHQLLLAAERFRADLVVVGSNNLGGLESFLLGSVSSNVARHARCPVLVARPPQNDLRRALLATDGSEQAERAARFAAALPLPLGTEITVAHVVRWVRRGPAPEDLRGYEAVVDEGRRAALAAGEAHVEAVRARLAAAGRRVTTAVREGDPAAELLALAEHQEADLILAGARGASLVERLLVGSVADRLLKRARCSLLIVH